MDEASCARGQSRRLLVGCTCLIRSDLKGVRLRLGRMHRTGHAAAVVVVLMHSTQHTVMLHTYIKCAVMLSAWFGGRGPPRVEARCCAELSALHHGAAVAGAGGCLMLKPASSCGEHLKHDLHSGDAVVSLGGGVGEPALSVYFTP